MVDSSSKNKDLIGRLPIFDVNSDFRKAHDRGDTDVDAASLHHTLGKSATQAAAGNHTHDELYVKDEDTDWIDCVLENGWVTFDALRTPRYRRKNGIVYTEGVVKNGTVGGTFAIFTYGVGFRCSNRATHDKNLPIVSNGVFGLLGISGSGLVALQTGSNAWVDLSGIPPFIAEN